MLPNQWFSTVNSFIHSILNECAAWVKHCVRNYKQNDELVELHNLMDEANISKIIHK